MCHKLVPVLTFAAAVLVAACGQKPPECLDQKQDWIFCADFDNDDLGQWDALPEGQTRTLLNHPAPAGAVENTSLQLRVPPGSGGIALRKTLARGYDQLYARWYVLYEDGFDFSAKNHGNGLAAGERYANKAGHRPKGDDWFNALVEHTIVPSTQAPAHFIYTYNRGMRMDCWDPEGRCWGDHIPCMLESDRYCTIPSHLPTVEQAPINTGQWYCIELHIDAGSPVANADDADGILNFWVDGVSIGPWNNMWFRTTEDLRISQFWLGLYHHGEHSVEGKLFDNVVLSTSRIGCL